MQIIEMNNGEVDRAVDAVVAKVIMVLSAYVNP